MSGNTLRLMASAINGLRDVLSPACTLGPASSQALMADMGEAPRDTLHGSDEAKLRALASDLVRRRGGEIASHLADLLVKAVQEERRQ